MDAFNRFDFDKDDNWKAYLRTVELPGGNTPDAMLRVKARWFKKNIDPDFDTTLVSQAPKMSQGARNSDSSAKAESSTGARSGWNASSTNAGGAGSGYSARTQPPPRYGNTGGGTYGSLSAQWRLFFMHLAIVLLGAFVTVPFLPYSRTAYVYLMRLAIISLAYKIYLQHGLPGIRPFSMLTAWVQRVMPTADFLQLITAFCFSAQPPMVLVAVPLAVVAAYHVAAFCSANLAHHPLWRRFGARAYMYMQAKQADALLLNAWCEVGTVLALVLQLLTPARSFLTLLFYVQILKLKLHVPDTALQHREVWRKIDDVTRPYRARAPPALEQGIQLAVRWFMNVPGAQ